MKCNWNICRCILLAYNRNIKTHRDVQISCKKSFRSESPSSLRIGFASDIKHIVRLPGLTLKTYVNVAISSKKIRKRCLTVRCVVGWLCRRQPADWLWYRVKMSTWRSGERFHSNKLRFFSSGNIFISIWDPWESTCLAGFWCCENRIYIHPAGAGVFVVQYPSVCGECVVVLQDSV